MLESPVMKRFLGRMRRAFPLRPGALVLLGVAFLIVLVVSPDEGDFLLYPAGLVAIGLVALSMVVTLAGAFWLARQVRRLPVSLPAELETDAPTGTGFRFPSLGRALMLDVQLEWVEPAGLTVRLEAIDGLLSEVVTAGERGRFEHVVRRFTVRDLFGLAALSFDFKWPCALRIVPRAAKQSAQLAAGRAQGETLANPAGRVEGDLVEMRQYAHGDPLRHVLWKAYARTGKLLVRMPERALSPGPVSVAFFVAGDQDEASAGAARLYVEAGLLGADLLFSADGAHQPARTARDAVDQLVDSHAQRSHGGDGLDVAAAQMDPARLTSCLFFVPPVDGPWKQKTLDFVRKHRLDATVIIGVDDAGERPPPPGRVESLLFRQAHAPDARRPALTALKSSLEAAGLQVRVLHRGTGQVL